MNKREEKLERALESAMYLINRLDEINKAFPVRDLDEAWCAYRQATNRIWLDKD